MGMEQAKIELRNPFDLATVVWLVALISAITLATSLASASLGQAGTLTLAAVSGLVDVDAVTLSMVRLSGTSIPADVVAQAVLLAVGANTASKAAMAVVAGGRTFGLIVAAVSTLALAAMFGAVLMVPVR